MAAKGKIVNTTNLREFKRRGRLIWGNGTYSAGRRKAKERTYECKMAARKARHDAKNAAA